MDGKFVTYYQNGNNFCEGWYEKGRRHGSWIWYYPNAKIKHRCQYEHVLYTGKFARYFPNGTIAYEAIYVIDDDGKTSRSTSKIHYCELDHLL